MLEIFCPGSTACEERMKTIRGRMSEWAGLTENKDYRITSKRVFGSVLPPDEAVRRIVRDVRDNGDKALLSYTKAFDNTDMPQERIQVSPQEIEQSLQEVPEEFKSALKKAVSRVETFQRKILDSRKPVSGTELSQRQTAVDRAGIYIPGGIGGDTPLVSSVYMNVIPAQAAGVEDIIVCTPPGPDGALSPYMCAALSACGITRVFRAGGAQAIAAMAYGTETIPRADIVAGPGNLFVMLAKKEVFGQAGIDLLAGPSEICVIADTTADPACAAADLLSQAEHDPLSSSILITDSRSFAEQVNDEISRRLQGLSRSKTAESALSRYGAVILTDSLAEAAETANRIAPEHLEIMTQEPSALVPLIRNAGTVFLGRSSPEALGDYIAGPSHTLPTGGTARFSSGLSAETFLKRTSVISISEKTFEELSVDAMVLARTEGLEAHRDSISVRTE